MLKRYSFFGVTLELLAVAGGFAALLLLVVVLAAAAHVRQARRQKAVEAEEGDA
ncbi:hypothetical protein [Paenibacillus mucilaginosus]|uniref:Uncharacterized protein n=3 Tax=Paenibacillus mucilaginosus TaxID=61624 RepID=H6NR27_9BACL|nr:hypothetical protein [Paenibacillus mucilaginosus]AEI44981.1 hypothetical protein KNP414_06460 [Paenibacillus mucilaginosus KNP414]AFC32720.1 hypothetical protein PM3016_6073 [Paenibacillus mucilaginosus 3016]AFH65052.1 hypothetical protein B2K_30840 [Paenibacillus mucilaginosus K02]MCG7213110.1 hypothetical protein [Paenibacillus mucilaginosus]WDM26488.1 hypothetical protein KCX80_29320 [Paenibacillus mucilaginosus]